MSSASSYTRLQQREHPWEIAVDEIAGRLIRPSLDCFPADIVGSIPQASLKLMAKRIIEYMGGMGFLDVWEIIATEGRGVAVMTDSDIPAPHEHEPEATFPEPTQVFEIRSKQVDERPRYWTGSDFALRCEEAKQFSSRDDAILELSGLRAGAYIVCIGL